MLERLPAVSQKDRMVRHLLPYHAFVSIHVTPPVLLLGPEQALLGDVPFPPVIVLSFLPPLLELTAALSEGGYRSAHSAERMETVQALEVALYQGAQKAIPLSHPFPAPSGRFLRVSSGEQ
jgi:hypothetical protein